MFEPLVSVVIVNYNGREYLRQCLDSVLNNLYPKADIIVVDNNSDDDSVAMVKELFPSVKVICNDKNYGPAYARNKGIEAACGEFIAFLDNDTRVHPGWLKEAIKVFNKESDIGACQCKLILDNRKNIIDCVGEYLGQNGFLVQVTIAGEEIDRGQYDQIREIFAAKSAGMIARRVTLEEVGDFDEDFFIYMEETDLCWRMWLRGYKVVLIPTSIVYHKFGTTTIVLPDKINYLAKFHGTKNYIATLIKNLGCKSLLIILPLHILLWVAISLTFLLKRQFKSTKWILQGILWDIVHLHKLLKKRKIIQEQRSVSDKELFSIIMKRKPLGYFIAKLRHKNNNIGHGTGWDKGE